MTGHPLGASRWILTRGGHPLHLRVAGSGGPVVVFESGMGGSALAWAAVAPSIATRTTTVVYDRAGLGRSPDVDGPRDLEHLADDLEDVLDAVRSEAAGPPVLVGHSWGGPIVRTVAARRPDGVRGLVLVDQTDEGCELALESDSRRRDRILVAVYPWVARLGLMRPVFRRQAKALPRALRDEYARTEGAPTVARAMLGELDSFVVDLRRLHDHPLDPPGCPVTIISGTRPGRGEQRSRPALVAAHRARAASLARGRWVEAPASGHMVMLSEPSIVVEEIVAMLDGG